MIRKLTYPWTKLQSFQDHWNTLHFENVDSWIRFGRRAHTKCREFRYKEKLLLVKIKWKIGPDLIFNHVVILSPTSATCRQMREMKCIHHTGNYFTTLLLTNEKNFIQSTTSSTETEKKHCFPYFPLVISCSQNPMLFLTKGMVILNSH